MKKYILTDEYIEHYCPTRQTKVKLYRIKAVRDFGAVLAGTWGGYIESEANLSHGGDCWLI